MSELASPATYADDVPILNLAKGVSLTLGSDRLVIKDRALAKRNRTRYCGVSIGNSPAETTLSYYNILWVAVDDNALVIDYATESPKTQPRRAKLQYILGEVPIATAQIWVEALLDRAYGQAQRQRRAKVIVNPHAGPGGAVRLWEHDVKPLFEAAGMSLDVVKTTRGGEGTDICEALDINAYDVVVVCSGDGLAYEVFNGLGKRADAGRALQKIAIAHIPCGSGNAMSLNLNGSHLAGPSALAVIKGIRTSVDLMSITQGSQRTLSFLSQSVGIIAECDLGTEHMRWLGAKRFDVGVVQRIFSKKVYPCDISIKVEIENKDQVKAHYKRIRGDGGKGQGVGQSSTETSLSASDSTGEGLPPLRFGTVNDELPEDWQTASYDKLGNFYCGNMAWMAPNANFFNAACMNDGLMDVVVNDGDISALKYIDLMTSVESGKFFDNPLLSYRKVAAYRFTPKNQADGYISIDGERVPFEPFQVEIHPGLGTVLSKTGQYEADGPPDWEKST
ncbi:putative diacylglycerol kinase catalytic domain-containing protein [Rosellinia necatrix]|uniref:Putative diacylglycerol kinase catalytic domain-containing protein n=1 Tax=Rosellinia necatrix TaxID=77044 RepID=A0A1W2TV89_ROSNE|nr:putative diacylglycerol kinase catalytic domain-containing protein [Rosellinia necatrix]